MEYLLSQRIAALLHDGAPLSVATATAYYELGLDMTNP